SPVNRTALWAAKTLERTSPSFGVISPSPMAADTLVIAREICCTFSMGGRSKWIGRALRGGMSRSRQRRSAVMSPAIASSIAFRVNCSASPSSRDSISKVAWLRLPGGRPDGLPLVPLENWPEPLVRLVDICFPFAPVWGALDLQNAYLAHTGPTAGGSRCADGHARATPHHGVPASR